MTVCTMDQNIFLSCLGSLQTVCPDWTCILFARASRIALVKLPLSVQDCQPITAIAPCEMLKDLSGIIRSMSNSILYPRPKQSGHAPNGLLKEKLLGSISSILIWQSGHAKLWLNVRILPSIVSTIRSPSDRSSTVSIESDKRFSISRFDHQTVYNDLNIMLDILIQLDSRSS